MILLLVIDDITNFVKKTDKIKKLNELNKNELNELSKKFKAISKKRLRKGLIINLVFLLEQNIFHEIFFMNI